MSRGASLDLASPSRERAGGLSAVRLLLPPGWLLAAVGCYGPWIGHSTAALALTGIDMGEFVKFLPAVQAGELPLARQLFYLPAFVVVMSVALLVGAPGLRYGKGMRAAALVLAVPVSLQLLPPAWSPASLMGDEFRLQLAALAVCWGALAASWLLGRLPAWLLGATTASLAAGALGASAWQMWAVKPEIDALYGRPPALGWGFYACLVGLIWMLACSLWFVARGGRSREWWGSRSR
ncbi:MAG: hypothetical protein JXA93_16850 [Anaerolineae bacterium]|nr:hypothetical protein [Anaerolineae bacterium]